MAPGVGNKTQTKAYVWDGEQGNYIKSQISSGVLSAKPKRDEFKRCYEAATDGILNFRSFARSWNNTKGNLGIVEDPNHGARETKARAKSKARATPSGGKMQTYATSDSTTKTSTATKTRSGSTQVVSPTGMLTATPKKALVWETLHSFWVDKDKNDRLHLFVVLPSGCRPKDVQVMVTIRAGRKPLYTHGLSVCSVPNVFLRAKTKALV